jgi:hypothetical protein
VKPELAPARLPAGVSGLGSERPTDWDQSENLLASMNLLEITHQDDERHPQRALPFKTSA